ncbi:DUF1254 domain-containing protein [Hoeflea sp. YIM 152468]|uniref:DUF1254 domain-containing protein n=1 Tax=Hoeflea sp. YIM 152468 TaxID=3031759 RepID=UPI0023DA7C32|nr:DUF1254 domain-containing protein [Hoeflea sp. YIM 152468]MDF1607291.1 DUF1254 domain-containing protein [Hoeflea sp. YIM 152468]
MRSLLLAIAIGLLGAAFIHIIIILALPLWTGTDSWTRVKALGASNRFYALANEPNTTGLYNENPNVRTAVCHFDVSDGPIRIIASGDVPIWTVSAYDSSANETYSMNDRSAIGSGVNIAFVTPAQMLQLRRIMPPALEQAVLVELTRPEAYVALRVISPTPSHEPAARAFLDTALCQAMSLESG